MNDSVNFVRVMRNPQAFLQQCINNNQLMQSPMAKNAYSMLQNGDSAGLEKMARNMCAEKGIQLEDVIRQIKQQFGM
jgi:hypothetical protein